MNVVEIIGWCCIFCAAVLGGLMLLFFISGFFIKSYPKKVEKLKQEENIFDFEENEMSLYVDENGVMRETFAHPI